MSFINSEEFLAFVNPTPAGVSINIMLAFLFQEYSLYSNLCSYSTSLIGPISSKNPAKEEHPGPPFNHKNKGSFSGEF